MKSIELARIDLNLLVAFEALFEEHSVTAAAQRLYLGQPAMSAALGRLRTLFDDPLFVRVGREMQPTTKAVAIAPDISVALDRVRQTIQSSQGFEPASDRRKFAIGSADYTSFMLLPQFSAYCQQVAPNINLRTIEFTKDEVGTLLEKGIIHLAIGVFPDPPRQTICVPLFQEQFVGIARKDHPALIEGSMSLTDFISLSHVLYTSRRDDIGEIDLVLAESDLQRRVAITVPHLLVLPSIVAATDLIAAIPSHMARYLTNLSEIELFELPIEVHPWTISLLWSQLSDRDPGCSWLRKTLEELCRKI
jgi:DNA-binding transcriptional LysR family regulator